MLHAVFTCDRLPISLTRYRLTKEQVRFRPCLLVPETPKIMCYFNLIEFAPFDSIVQIRESAELENTVEFVHSYVSSK